MLAAKVFSHFVEFIQAPTLQL